MWKELYDRFYKAGLIAVLGWGTGVTLANWYYWTDYKPKEHLCSENPYTVQTAVYCYYPYPIGGYVGQISANEGYGLPIPTLLSDYMLPPDTVFTGEVINHALETSSKGSAYLIVQARNPIVVNSTIYIPPNQILQGGHYQRAAGKADTMEDVIGDSYNMMQVSENSTVRQVFIDGGGMVAIASNPKMESPP